VKNDITMKSHLTSPKVGMLQCWPSVLFLFLSRLRNDLYCVRWGVRLYSILNQFYFYPMLCC